MCGKTADTQELVDVLPGSTGCGDSKHRPSDCKRSRTVTDFRAPSQILHFSEQDDRNVDAKSVIIREEMFTVGRAV